MIFPGDSLDVLSGLPDCSVQSCVTSPPYWGLRDYGVSGQIGLESSPDEYIRKLVSIFREVKRVLKNDGTLWIVIGDSYTSGGRKTRDHDKWLEARHVDTRPPMPAGLKAKDLVGIPWMLAFALRADGWFLRQEIIWSKPNPVPESVRDRCTKAHETVFLLSKSKNYFFDHKAIQEPSTYAHEAKYDNGQNGHGGGVSHEGQGSSTRKFSADPTKRNKRSVWNVRPKPFKGAHFATFPPDLIEPMILAGTRPGDMVLDPFFGSGTVAVVANRFDRQWIGIELNESYIEVARKRIAECR